MAEHSCVEGFDTAVVLFARCNNFAPDEVVQGEEKFLAAAFAVFFDERANGALNYVFHNLKQ